MPERPSDDARCPCLSGETYGSCCGPFHRGDALAPTAERLMRSRYTAFAIRDADYLLATWHPRTRPAELELDAGTRWFRLEIVATSRGGMLDTAGEVEFEARWKDAAGAHLMKERSQFLRSEKRWLYLDGAVTA